MSLTITEDLYNPLNLHLGLVYLIGRKICKAKLLSFGLKTRCIIDLLREVITVNFYFMKVFEIAVRFGDRSLERVTWVILSFI